MIGAQIEACGPAGTFMVSFPHEEGGRADLDTVRTFFTQNFFDETSDARNLIIDLNGVSTLDSSALSPLVQRLRELQGNEGNMVLCNIRSPGLREILSLTRFDRIFKIFDSREQAIQAIGS